MEKLLVSRCLLGQSLQFSAGDIEIVEAQRAMLVNEDGEIHKKHRRIISRGFTPRAIGRLEDELRARARKIAETAAAAGSGDFVEQVSCELPLQAIADLLGVHELRPLVWARKGCPYRADRRNRYWFDVAEVRTWLASGKIRPRDLAPLLARMDGLLSPLPLQEAS